MKAIVLIVTCLIAHMAFGQAEPVAATAWFTDAVIEDSVQAPQPRKALPKAPGTFGQGVRLTEAVPIQSPVLAQVRGYISFWLKPDWNGNDGKTHRLLLIGDPAKNGLLVEKSDLGMLRFVMASPKKISAARADVSDWQAGEWHHLVIVWKDLNDKPLGMALFIDKKAVDGPVTADNAFLDPVVMKDQRIWIGDKSSGAVMDEFIIRHKFVLPKDEKVGKAKRAPQRLEALVYRDYFRTAPYTAVRIDPEPFRVPADRRVVAGFEKQFGLEGKLVGGRIEDMTDFVVRYGQWGDYDAGPFITWATSDEKIATVDDTGLVTGQTTGRCMLTAEYRGMKVSYDLEVVSVEQPDLDLAFVERLPRYASDRLKHTPEPGDRVTSVANIFNMGYKPVPAGTVVKFEIFPDTNRNYLVDPGEEKLAKFETRTIGALAPGEKTTVSATWTWPEEPTWVRVTVDPQNKVSEFCEANNRRCSLNIARAARWGHNLEKTKAAYDEKTMTLVGSFSTYDWIHAQVARVEVILREAVYPVTSPVGVQDSVRLDAIHEEREIFAGKRKFKDVEPKEEHDRKYFDGGWPHHEINHPMAIDSGILHECGHVMIALPDLYGYPMGKNRVYLKDGNGDLYEGGELLPYIHENGRLPEASVSGRFPCMVGYSSLMRTCHMWLDESNAGKVHYLSGFRGPQFWGVQGRLVPTWKNTLLVTDVNDRPLAGAAVYVYHVAQNNIQKAAAKYFHDRAKFMGNTDQDGQYVFPERTDKDWDDPTSDEVESGLLVWNPFGGAQGERHGLMPDVAFTPNVWHVEGLLLLKIVSGEQTEFHWLALPTFNTAYFKNQLSGVYPIRTSLRPADGVTELVRPEIPEAIRETNLRPVAVINTDADNIQVGKRDVIEVTVAPGEEFTLDASASHDPENQPLILYEWQARDRLAPAPRTATGPIYEGTAPKAPGECRMVFYVNDGLRVSKGVWITIKVVE